MVNTLCVYNVYILYIVYIMYKNMRIEFKENFVFMEIYLYRNIQINVPQNYYLTGYKIVVW